jgi:hypothetical protein
MEKGTRGTSPCREGGEGGVLKAEGGTLFVNCQGENKALTASYASIRTCLSENGRKNKAENLAGFCLSFVGDLIRPLPSIAVADGGRPSISKLSNIPLRHGGITDEYVDFAVPVCQKRRRAPYDYTLSYL